MEQSKIKIKATRVLEKIRTGDDKRNLVLQGSARSGKTYAIAQHVILKCLNEWDKQIITISRKTFPALRGSVMRDFFEILMDMGIYTEKDHNKTTNEYQLSGNLVEFVSVDQPQKVRGRKRDYCWLNEANEFDYESFLQFNIRTSKQVIFDYNPSDEYHWIYDKIIPRDDTLFFKSTFMDNPFLDQALIDEIYRLKDEDENLWKIYGLGELGKAKDLIYPNWDIKEFPAVCEHYRYGLDFGFNHPTSLVLVGIRENDVYVQQMIYQSHLTNQDLIDLMKEKGIAKNILIRADSAEPARITEIERAGFRVEPAKKDKGSVKDRIDSLKRRKIHITSTSPDIEKEIKNYRWKKDPKTDEVIDEPEKYKDDGCFVGDTMILMSDMSKKKIKDIVVGEYVVTDKGARKVLDVQLTQREAVVYKYVLGNGITVSCTPNHKFYTKKGIKRVDNIDRHDMLRVWESDQRYISITGFIIGMVNTICHLWDGLKVGLDYIGQFGNSIMVKSLQGIISIITMVKHGTTGLRIYPLLSENCTYHTMAKNHGTMQSVERKVLNILNQSAILQMNGTEQKKAGNSQAKILKSFGNTEKGLLSNVVCVVKNLKLHFQKGLNTVPTSVAKRQDVIGKSIMSFVNALFARLNLALTNIARQKLVHSIVGQSSLPKSNVYNLTVEDRHNYYANGILVSNCDSMAYAIGDIIRDEKLFKEWINDPIDDRRERQIKRQAVVEYDVLNY